MYDSLEKIANLTKETGLSFWEVVQREDCNNEEIEPRRSLDKMLQMYEAMYQSNANYDPFLKSASGFVGGEAHLLRKRIDEGKMMAGDFMSRVMEKALRVSANNACMKVIVAAPTAGACGVLPAVLLSYEETHDVTREKMAEALYVAGGIGGVIATRACISGAEGGCQAEVGSASSMAAGALVYLEGGDAEAIIHASAIAMKGLLGLACDPVGGLVEVPCVKRNVIGSINAVSAADMAMSGIRSKISPDHVIDAMRAIGKRMPVEIRETGLGGLAGTKSAQDLMRNKR